MCSKEEDGNFWLKEIWGSMFPIGVKMENHMLAGPAFPIVQFTKGFVSCFFLKLHLSLKHELALSFQRDSIM